MTDEPLPTPIRPSPSHPPGDRSRHPAPRPHDQRRLHRRDLSRGHAHRLDRLSAYFRKGEFLLAEDASGQLIGSIYTELRPPRGYLGMLAVDPAHQRAGHGRTLMPAGEDHLRGKGCMAVDISVIAWRTELPPIYRKLGYVETAIEDFQPSQKLKPGVPPCHSIIMSKPL